MAVSFSLIPSTVKTPLFYAEVDSTRAGQSVTNRPSLLVGQMLASGTAPAGLYTRIRSAAHAGLLFGHGSQVARAALAYFANDPYAEVWGLPLADHASGTAASRVVVIATSSPVAGTLPLYIGGQVLAVPVTAASTGTTLGNWITSYLGTDEAKAIALPVAVNGTTATRLAASQFPVFATQSAGTITFTARNKGLVANQIDIRVAYTGTAGGEAAPAGLTIQYDPLNSSTYGTTLVGTYCLLFGGTNNPLLTTLPVLLGSKRWHSIVHPYSDTTGLDAFRADLADSVDGRWGPIRRLYGQSYSARVGTYETLTALALHNDPHASVFGVEASPTPPYEIAAAYAGACSRSLRVDPARPLNTLPLAGVKAPAYDDQFSWADREILLGLGITPPSWSDDGSVRICRAISTYMVNAYGSNDSAYLDITTCANLDYQLTALEAMVTTKFGRHKLVSDGTAISSGQAAVCPSMIKAEIIAQYKVWERDGLVENTTTFVSNLVVERSESDPTRVEVIYPPDLANGLMVFALLAQFRLQYSRAELA